jgi:hypothetical protein
MKKPLSADKELKQVMSEINRINAMYAGQLNIMDDGFKAYVLKKVKDLTKRKNELMKELRYV